MATNTYDTAGRLDLVTHGSGKPSRDYTYDNLGRIDTDTTLRPNATVSASVDYSYDNDNLLTSKTTTGVAGAGANTYSYDDLSRVTGWLNPAGTTTTYGYDSASNRTTVTTPAGVRTSTYDERNRITGTTGASQPADSYTWNPRGQLVSATRDNQTTTYSYDAFERLTQVQKTAGYTVTFNYDSLDRPAQRGTANFGYNDLTNNPVVSPAALGETKLLRDPKGTALASKTGTNTAAFLLNDVLHTDINATTDPTTGDLTTSTSYDPWGALTGTTGTLPPIGYQGGYTDPDTGLVNAHHRWYDPTLGTFTSRDTLTLTPPPVAQTNRYLYTNANPLTGRDPDGHMNTVDIGGGLLPEPPQMGCAWTGDCQTSGRPSANTTPQIAARWPDKAVKKKQIKGSFHSGGGSAGEQILRGVVDGLYTVLDEPIIGVKDGEPRVFRTAT